MAVSTVYTHQDSTLGITYISYWAQQTSFHVYINCSSSSKNNNELFANCMFKIMCEKMMPKIVRDNELVPQIKKLTTSLKL